MKILYNIHTGDIFSIVNDDVDVGFRYRDYPSEILDNLMELPCDFDNIYNGNKIHYKVVDGNIIDRPKNEVYELRRYGKVLSDEERVDIMLQPSQDEIRKAENTIELISLLQEVNAI